MKPFVPFTNPREACDEVGKAADKEIGRLVRRPWNMYEPDETSWWLVPSSDWPAFRYGKFFFDWGAKDQTSILLGLYVEKGIGPSAQSAFTSPKDKRLLMQSDWTWFSFLHDLKGQRIGRAIEKAAEDTEIPIYVRVDGGYESGSESFDPYGLRLGWGMHLLRWNTDSKDLVLEESESERHLLDELTAVATVDDLTDALEVLSGKDWIWVDVFIAARFSTSQPESAGDEMRELWSADAIWRKFLRHFRSWVV